MDARAEPPLVSVIMPAYNAARFIGAAIESVLAQTYRNLELIVVDDGSTDATATVVTEFGNRVRYIYQDNARQAAARNVGLRYARGELLAFLDADDLWLPEKLERQVARLALKPGLGLVLCTARVIDAEGREVGQLRSDLASGSCESVLLGEFRAGSIASAGLIPRRVIEAVGGFDISLPPCEDTDLLWRIASKYPIDRVEEALVLYRLHPGNDHANVDRMTHAWMSMYRKAFRDPAVRRLGWRFRRRCSGRLYYMLAGDHWHAGRMVRACCYGLRGCLSWPPILFRASNRFLRSKITAEDRTWRQGRFNGRAPS
jgi:glycosyltransferase involved in cell wall biosynthesis